MMSWVAGLMIGIRLLWRGTFHSPSMNSCLLGTEMAIFLFAFSFLYSHSLSAILGLEQR